MQLKSKISPGFWSIFLIVLAWELTARTIGLPALFPPLSNIIIQLFELFTSATFYHSLGTTILRGLTGFIISLSASFILAILAYFKPFWKEFLHPLVLIFRSVPVISIVLIALLWFSPPMLPIFIALITMFPILYQSILNGLEQTDQRLIEMGRVYKKPNLNIVTGILLPSASVVIYGGISTAMGFGWRAIIIGEVLAQPLHGIGTQMKKAQAYIDMQELMAWTFIAIAVSYIFEYLFKHPIHKKLFLDFKFKENKLIKKIYSDNIKEITISDLNKSFNDKIICNQLNLSIKPAQIHWLRTSSGSGKTTLLRLIAGLEKADSGNISIDQELSIGYAFQETRLLPWLTVNENLKFVINFKNEIPRSEMMISFLIEKLNLKGLENQYPGTLSGGEKQRVELARALIIRPDILLLDEPLNGLDKSLKESIFHFLMDYIEENKIMVVWATHDDPKV